MSKQFKEEQVIKILEQFGYKCYNSGNEKYLLQVRQKFRPTTKLSIDKVMTIFNSIIGDVKEVKDAPIKLKAKAKVEEVKE